MGNKRIQERLNKIFLIGNGFDLGHNLPTSYIDFIKWYLKNCVLKAIDTGASQDECITVQIELGFFFQEEIDIKEFCEQIFNGNTYLQYIGLSNSVRSDAPLNHNRIKINAKSEFIYNLLLNCNSQDWGGIEDEIYREIIRNHNTLIKYKSEISGDKKIQPHYIKALKYIKILNATVNHLKTQLIDYLKIHNNPTKLRPELFISENNDWGQKYLSKHEYSAGIHRKVLFLNFNYTTYIDDQIKKDVKYHMDDIYTNFQTIQIHGDINGDLDNVIFGVGDENKEIYSEIESLYDDDWLMSMKSFHYLRNESYQNLLGFIDDGDYEVFVIGHSCSITDRTLLNMLFENDACKKIHIYHYSGINSYLKTAYNIARNFNDKVRLRKVLQPFNEKLSTK